MTLEQLNQSWREHAQASLARIDAMIANSELFQPERPRISLRLVRVAALIGLVIYFCL